jgi:hypothetical protein
VKAPARRPLSAAGLLQRANVPAKPIHELARALDLCADRVEIRHCSCPMWMATLEQKKSAEASRERASRIEP